MEPLLPVRFNLTAYPNPFNAQATLSFTLPQTGRTSLTIFDVLGRVVQSYPAEVLQAGQHQIRLDAGNLATGSYWVKLATENHTAVNRLTLVR
ncbi:MAG: T9SS type A sorting domain-containing protein [bacterium]|nr:T9SS type A sorting domain-containing protein [bacterium]